jgi:hypothetical protein
MEVRIRSWIHSFISWRNQPPYAESRAATATKWWLIRGSKEHVCLLPEQLI